MWKCSFNKWLTIIGKRYLCYFISLSGLTTWSCLPPRSTIMTTIPWPFLLLLFYALLDKEPIGKKEIIPFSEDHPPVEDDTTTFSFRDRLNVAKDIFPYITFLFITYFSEYLSNHAVITTLAFPNAPFKPRDHYPYYILSYHVGKFMGRSHFFLVSAINPKLVHYIRVRRTWILALIASLHGLFFFLASWYRFVPRVEIIIALCFTEGFTAGSMYLNSAHTVSELIADQQKKEFALSLLTVGNACGKLAAGLCGLFQEPLLKKHCVEDLKLGEYCLTRHTRKAGWNKSFNCWIFNYCYFRRKLGDWENGGNGGGGRGKERQGNLVLFQYLSRYLFSRPIFSSGPVSDPSLSKFVIHFFLFFLLLFFFWGGGEEGVSLGEGEQCLHYLLSREIMWSFSVKFCCSRIFFGYYFASSALPSQCFT